ncbi:MAG: hypothetical protein JWO30_3430 [Fibrobacteres bacterium]|nr:hypothetical protein [Fibrobacterota bacterium]
MQVSKSGLPVLAFKSDKDWSAWLKKNHAKSTGLWIRLPKKATGTATVSYDEAVETALCYGWIDGQKSGESDSAWLQRFSPRGPRSIWSKINRDRVAKLVKTGRMMSAGAAAVERAKQGGQWEAAYDSPKGAAVSPEFQVELDKSKAATAFFATLNGANRYAILWRIQTAKKPETKARRIREFIAMLEKKEKLYP